MSTKRKIVEVKNGPIKATLEANREALALFDQKVANDIVRTALAGGGAKWVEIFLPERFGPYAYKLGYKVSAKTRDRKRRIYGHDRPYTQTGEMAGATQGAHVEATAKRSGGVIRIRIPMGHALRPEFMSVFRQVPAWEVDRINAEVVRIIAAELNDATYSADESGVTRATRSVFRAAASPPASRPRARRPRRAA